LPFQDFASRGDRSGGGAGGIDPTRDGVRIEETVEAFYLDEASDG
jgi:hypothetical protein